MSKPCRLFVLLVPPRFSALSGHGHGRETDKACIHGRFPFLSRLQVLHETSKNVTDSLSETVSVSACWRSRLTALERVQRCRSPDFFIIRKLLSAPRPSRYTAVIAILSRK